MADNDIVRIKRPVEMRPIPGFEGYSITRNGRIWSHRKRLWRKPQMDKKGYHFLMLQDKNLFVHSLVMAAWGPPKPSAEYEINHCDTNKLNNHISNLEWLTHLQNIRHGLSLGRRSSGEFTKERAATVNRDKLGRFAKRISNESDV